VNTGNNLLYLLLGAMLGAMGVSGWLSERTLRGLRVVRAVPRGVPVDQDFRIRYRVTNRKRWLSSYAVELEEPGLPGVAFLPGLPAGSTLDAHATDRFVRRGVYALECLTLSTEYPFGLFRKERDVVLPGELVVWPRTDRSVPGEILGGGDTPASSLSAGHPASGPRGEFRNLREYRSGDDARDIHWRTSARLREPVVREYERDASEVVWIALHLDHPPGADAEAAVEVAASLCARAAARGRSFALTAGPHQVEPGSGPVHLERALDALARADFGTPGLPTLPVPRDRAVLVTPGPSVPGFAKVIRTGGTALRRDAGEQPSGGSSSGAAA
jgi:uncharacterized protein (DUF58 family)